jgi:transketolase
VILPHKTVTMKFSSFAIAGVVLASASVNGFSTSSAFGVRQFSQLQMSTAVDADTKTSLSIAANEARGIAMDSIAAAHSGHMGLPLGAAEIGAVLYGSQVCFIFLRI